MFYSFFISLLMGFGISEGPDFTSQPSFRTKTVVFGGTGGWDTKNGGTGGWDTKNGGTGGWDTKNGGTGGWDTKNGGTGGWDTKN
jgi:hypothetical protein